jgi:hypothetical protein
LMNLVLGWLQMAKVSLALAAEMAGGQSGLCFWEFLVLWSGKIS